MTDRDIRAFVLGWCAGLAFAVAFVWGWFAR